jgi:hypothetical protein
VTNDDAVRAHVRVLLLQRCSSLRHQRARFFRSFLLFCSHDATQDSSQIINDVLSAYQRSLLDMIFMRDADNRSKFNVITRCSAILSTLQQRAAVLLDQANVDTCHQRLHHAQAAS